MVMTLSNVLTENEKRESHRTGADDDDDVDDDDDDDGDDRVHQSSSCPSTAGFYSIGQPQVRLLESSSV